MKLRPKFVIPAVFVALALVWIGMRIAILRFPSKLKVSPDTTVVTGPLRTDGTVDYEAALNERFSKGNTLENNAVVLLERAFGPSIESPELRLRYYRSLGTDAPPLKGQYMVSMSAFAQQQTGSSGPRGEKYDALMAELGHGGSRLWTRDEFPRVAAWIDVNKQALTLIEAASRRTQYYSPVVADNLLVSSSLETVAENMRAAARLLIARALLHISEGDLTGAADDLLTCHRLSHLIGQNSSLIANLVAMGMDSIATHGDQVWLAQTLSIEQIQRFQNELAGLSPVANVAAALDQNERLVLLDAVQSISLDRSVSNDIEGLNNLFLFSAIDVNSAMRRCNMFFDGIALAQKIEVKRDRIAALEKVQIDLRQRSKNSVSPGGFVSRLVWDSRQTISESSGDLLLMLLAPATTQPQQAQDRANQRRELLHVGLALAAYRTKHGNYPQQLEALVPDFLKQVPLDHFIDRPLRYQVTQDGYLMYSVGPDEQDDGGKPIQNHKGDVVFQMPTQIGKDP